MVNISSSVGHVNINIIRHILSEGCMLQSPFIRLLCRNLHPSKWDKSFQIKCQNFRYLSSCTLRSMGKRSRSRRASSSPDIEVVAVLSPKRKSHGKYSTRSHRRCLSRSPSVEIVENSSRSSRHRRKGKSAMNAEIHRKELSRGRVFNSVAFRSSSSTLSYENVQNYANVSELPSTSSRRYSHNVCNSSASSSKTNSSERLQDARHSRHFSKTDPHDLSSGECTPDDSPDHSPTVNFSNEDNLYCNKNSNTDDSSISILWSSMRDVELGISIPQSFGTSCLVRGEKYKPADLSSGECTPEESPISSPSVTETNAEIDLSEITAKSQEHEHERDVSHKTNVGKDQPTVCPKPNQGTAFDSGVNCAHSPAKLPNNTVQLLDSNHRPQFAPQRGISTSTSSNVACREEQQLYEHLKSLRCWNYTEFGAGLEFLKSQTASSQRTQKDTDHEMEILVMSYNVLSQELLDMYPSLYRDSDPRSLPWKYRGKRLLNELQEANADILCLQEIHDEHYEDMYKPHMESLGYCGVFKKRTGDKHDGCAIFYRDDRFSLVDLGSVEYQLDRCFELGKDNVALVAKLKPKDHRSSDVHLVIATTHLLFNPKRCDVKLAQLQMLLAEIDKLAYKEVDTACGIPSYHPVIVTGDMNFDPETSVYSFLTKGYLKFEGLSHRRLDYFSGGRVLGSHLIPPEYGIMDTCQYSSMHAERTAKAAQTLERFLPDMQDPEGETKPGGESPQTCPSDATDGSSKANSQLQTFAQFMRLVKDKRQTSAAEPRSSENAKRKDKPAGIFDTGILTHNLCLRSAYTHRLSRLDDRKEVTTFHDEWKTVDYIFYSTAYNPSTKERSEDALKLIGTLGLLSANECISLGGLPNLSSPSDHLSLMAKFMLKLR